MKLNKLKVNPNNPQTFDDLSKLKASVKDFPKMMALRPLVYDPKTMHVLGGNKRLVCLQELNYKDIPDEWVRAADELTEEEKQRFIIADNVGFGEWDTELLSEFWNSEDLEEWGLELPEDFGEKNKEIDVDTFENQMQIVLKYTEVEYWKVKEQLSKIAETPEQAIYKLLGNE